MLRRQFLTGAAALTLASCTPGTESTTTIADVIAELRKQCSFATEWESIAKVITTIVTGFNAAAGAATTIATAVAKQVVDMVCGAVKAQAAQLKAEKKSVAGTITVVVNGVEVPGVYGG
jgi:ABC-type Zn2+ transport system substrate-binding protein/surface adhesin